MDTRTKVASVCLRSEVHFHASKPTPTPQQSSPQPPSPTPLHHQPTPSRPASLKTFAVPLLAGRPLPSHRFFPALPHLAAAPALSPVPGPDETGNTPSAFRHDRSRPLHTSRASLVLAVPVESASLEIVAQPDFCISTTLVQGLVSYA
ncbi:hypothetical protein CH063_06853 [Colletotrichum higginsianum]|uniref:Uncharacterized protein n=1 Tax=Colletotrichum higginsianum (strain IMI 349063) TaxID=759273 RepID=H1V427_COLHI|nr:hypothetical protein CH63R_09266 [Colletotrichum higginsianum IMI 349063]OBR07745.1 hypothetical protein CH63R_09266 [Colletotrichum higginsianum IMI 349063]CCF34979.1 hypothetical protein CH063_06853 [Colletotrichum higginsianum]